MTSDAFIALVYNGVSLYLALFCLITILGWGGCSYFLLAQWQKPVRDAVTYFAAIGALTLLLVLRPVKFDMTLWAPITWFGFTMLMVLELFWLTYLVEGLMRMIFRLPRNLMPPQTPEREPGQRYQQQYKV